MISEELMDDPQCMCCPMMDVCTVENDVIINISKDTIKRSNCNGGFVDAFETPGAL
jgi:hypothetical protein